MPLHSQPVCSHERRYPGRPLPFRLSFFFTDSAPTGLSTLSLQTLFRSAASRATSWPSTVTLPESGVSRVARIDRRSEEHTSELQSHSDLVCRLLLEKKNQHPEKRDPTLGHDPVRRVGHDSETLRVVSPA